MRFSTQARTRLVAVIEAPLDGLGPLTGSETFDYELVIPPAKQAALKRALSIMPLGPGPPALSAPDQPLRFQMVFHPQKTLSAHLELIVSNSSGAGLR